MLIKKLEIRGFKTFADNTEIEFAPGITAVVGPNGSGKSNISDAIAWVMGESNVRNLRANKTEDVIFNGSAKRKAVGLAEVSITFDNASGKLPIGFEEVTITRRAYRSGESEYFINKTACRLRDIFELFLDSGVGRGAYSMVSQGQIDELLTGKPEDRRELLEEAAGVKKYRHKRHETQRKLQHTQDNISRVDDIMQELQAQMEPLASQAETAIRYKELTERLKEIEVGLLVSKVQTLDSELKAWRETEASLTEQLSEIEAGFGELENREMETSARFRAAQEELEAAHKVHSDAQVISERLRSDLAIAQAKKGSAEEGRNRLSEEIEALSVRLEDFRSQLETQTAEFAEVSEIKKELEDEVIRLRGELEDLSASISLKEKTLTEQELGIRNMAQDRAARESRLESCRARIAQLEEEIVAVQERIQDLSQRRNERAKELDRQSDLVKTESETANSLAKRLDTLLADLEDEQDSLDSASAMQEEAAKTLVERSSRLKMLKEMQEAREGYFAGVKAVLGAAKKGDLPDDYAVVADILDVPASLEQAVETALGSALQDIATSTFDSARQAIDFLKSNSLGRATFLPMDRLDKPAIFDRSKLGRGMLGVAYDLVHFDSAYEPVARLLLSRVLIAEDIRSAGEAANRLHGWSKIVTPDGELLVPSGAITGGSRLKKSSGLIERKREISDLETEIKRLADEHEAAQESVARLKASLAEMAEKIKTTRAEAEQARMRLAQAEGARDIAAASIRELQDAESDAAGRLESSQGQVDSLKQEVAALEGMLTSSGEEGGVLEEMLASQRDELAALQEKRASVTDDFRSKSNLLAAYAERASALGKSIAFCEEEIARISLAVKARRKELEDILQSPEISEEALQDLAADADAAHKAFEEAEVKLLETQARHQDRMTERQVASDALKEARETRESISNELHQIQITLARQEADYQQALERLWEDYEITKGDALTWPEPLLVKHGTATEVQRLRREIRLMGDVNTGAIAEFERVRERWEFLASQRADLEDAKNDLLEAIKEIDDSTRDLFMDTFNQVKAHFEEIFTLLFGGGVAMLELTKPEDLLETGIEVFVQPPGKKLQNMDLLSGGEKALTAQALLFALMRVKPSPFCVLDEVDAPLDDANVGRFASLVREYAKGSQFIIITHNRATMEAADTLYGVTMMEPGISRLVSAKLTEE